MDTPRGAPRSFREIRKADTAVRSKIAQNLRPVAVAECKCSCRIDDRQSGKRNGFRYHRYTMWHVFETIVQGFSAISTMACVAA